MPPRSLTALTKEMPSLSEVTASVVQNYGTANENAVQLNGLIDWITKQVVLYNKYLEDKYGKAAER